MVHPPLTYGTDRRWQSPPYSARASVTPSGCTVPAGNAPPKASPTDRLSQGGIPSSIGSQNIRAPWCHDPVSSPVLPTFPPVNPNQSQPHTAHGQTPCHRILPWKPVRRGTAQSRPLRPSRAKCGNSPHTWSGAGRGARWSRAADDRPPPLPSCMHQSSSEFSFPHLCPHQV